ncbi:MAG: hypothetical protein IT371_08725 [Deltaproteobacteria bacterium]|nr:hypothetical protein [Deltaproteobacteria bacterium]
MRHPVFALLAALATANLTIVPAATARAEPAIPVHPTTGLDPQRRLLALQQLDDQIADARSLKLGGMLLTFLGIVATATGAGLMPAAYEHSSQKAFQGAAWATLMVGLASLPVGLPFWVMGSKREKEYRDLKTRVILSVSPGRERQIVQVGFAF